MMCVCRRCCRVFMPWDLTRLIMDILFGVIGLTVDLHIRELAIFLFVNAVIIRRYFKKMFNHIYIHRVPIIWTNSLTVWYVRTGDKWSVTSHDVLPCKQGSAYYSVLNFKSWWPTRFVTLHWMCTCNCPYLKFIFN